jgi:hypothetical protein
MKTANMAPLDTTVLNGASAYNFGDPEIDIRWPTDFAPFESNEERVASDQLKQSKGKKKGTVGDKFANGTSCPCGACRVQWYCVVDDPQHRVFRGDIPEGNLKFGGVYGCRGCIGSRLFGSKSAREVSGARLPSELPVRY